MTDDVTQRLAEIEQRANAATKGPWGWRITGDRKWAEVFPPNGRYVARAPDDDNAEFIAHVREDAPWLIRVARNERAQINYMREEIAKALGLEIGSPSETVQSVRDLFFYAGVRDEALARNAWLDEKLEKSEASLTRVRELCDHWLRYNPEDRWAQTLREALGEEP